MGPSDSDTLTRGAPADAPLDDSTPDEPTPDEPTPDDSASVGHAAGFDPESESWPVDDQALVAASAEWLVAENRARAARMAAVARFHARRMAEAQEHGSGRPGFFVLTPLEATKAEFGPLLVISPGVVEAELAVADDLRRWFPRTWAMFLAGRIDISRIRVVHDQLEYLTCDEDKAAYAALIEAYLEKQDDPGSVVHPVDRRRLQSAARMKCRKFTQRTKEATFNEAYQKRRVSLRTDESGIAYLSCSTAVTEAMAADYRLTLIARKRRERTGEERTLEQLRVDTLLDLILGRLTVTASDGELEDDELADGTDPAEAFEAHPVGRFARPIVNVTVPITTLMGLSNAPGVLAGGAEIPAELVQQLAQDPSSTWYRLVTDPLGGFVELSTTRYAPTAPIWRYVVARDRTCIWPGCDKPATVIELDHRDPWPRGSTSVGNLQPLCECHHKVKHSDGFSVARNDDGSYTWTSRFGSTFTTPVPEYPVAVWPVEGTLEADTDVERLDLGSLMEEQFRAWMEEASPQHSV